MKKNILSLFSFRIILMIKLTINRINQKVKKLAEHLRAIVKDVKKVYQNKACFLFLDKTADEKITLLSSNAP